MADNELFNHLYSSFPESLREDGWYLAVASALVATHNASKVADLYIYLTSRKNFSTSIQRKRLSRRLRETLMKAWTLVGIPVVLEAVVALAKVERPEDKETGSARVGAELGPEVEARGTSFLQMLYKHNLQPIFNTFGSHAAELEWLEKNVIYGLFLADFSVLGAVETELAVMPAIMCQSLRAPTIWHLRGMRRVGISDVDIQAVEEVIKVLATHFGKDSRAWPSITDVPKDSDD
ncbi:MAG: hypothetical protein M1833_004094 [Piccolia ochrophora]|nr:MAG: hypothetical protein M1833_004094 [Piccolia ochrophora]